MYWSDGYHGRDQTRGYGLAVATPAGSEPVSLAEAKSHLNVGHADDDDLIAGLVAAARHLTEVETGRRWVPQVLTLSLWDFPRRRCFVTSAGVIPEAVYLPVEPVSAVAEVRYYDAAGTLTTLDTSAYLAWLAHSPPIVYPAPGLYWPLTQVGRAGAVEIDFAAGYDDVPQAAKQAIKIAVGFWYEHRGDSEEPAAGGLPPASLRLCRSLSTGAYS